MNCFYANYCATNTLAERPNVNTRTIMLKSVANESGWLVVKSLFSESKRTHERRGIGIVLRRLHLAPFLSFSGLNPTRVIK